MMNSEMLGKSPQEKRRNGKSKTVLDLNALYPDVSANIPISDCDGAYPNSASALAI